MIGARTTVRKNLVLIGGGHSHVGVLRGFGMKPEPGVRLTLVCRDIHTPYSGMLPGYVAGHYEHDDIHIDLEPLARFAQARFLPVEATGIDSDARRVHLRDRPPIPYDILSINIGSTPRLDIVPGAEAHAIPVKPIGRLTSRWLALLDRLRGCADGQTIAVVGGGAAGVEMILAMQHRLRALLGEAFFGLSFVLVTGKNGVLPTQNERCRRAFEKVLRSRDVDVRAGAAVQSVAERIDGAGGGVLTLDNGDKIVADEILWITQAGAASWPGEAGLETDPNGFISVAATLESTSHPGVFAVGDVAAMRDRPREKAGVFAVRQGPPLTANLRRALRGEPLKPFRPQSTWLALISTGDKFAVGAKGPFAMSGKWLWRWKNRIDRRFMARFRALPAMQMPAQAESQDEMRCGGCGAKLPAGVLSTAIARLREAEMPVDREDVEIGLQAPDDAASIAPPRGGRVIQSVDFFRAFIDDPYRFGRIAAIHALGDLWAMGARPATAQAIVTLPPGPDRDLAETLFQMLAGASRALGDAGAVLSGGHSAEGVETALGFAVTGFAETCDLMRKGGLRPGDRLVLTKPIGTGCLMAARAAGEAKGRWVEAALVSMQTPSAAAAEILRASGARACTDVTGFGLAGHLMEMAEACGHGLELELDAVPVLDGAERLAAAGRLSTLQPANLARACDVERSDDPAVAARWQLLFDPQTAGGLIAGVPAAGADDCVRRLSDAGYRAAIIGAVVSGRPCIRLAGGAMA